jgi:hypothetical protein
MTIEPIVQHRRGRPRNQEKNSTKILLVESHTDFVSIEISEKYGRILAIKNKKNKKRPPPDIYIQKWELAGRRAYLNRSLSSLI